MSEILHAHVEDMLENLNLTFQYSVDLGCGPGTFGSVFKKYTRYLVGIDYRENVLQSALQNGYDKVVCMDIRHYPIPPACDSVFMIESIEHIPKEDGYALLQRIGHRFIFLTTPSRLHPSTPWTNHHLSIWTREELEALGFNTYLIPISLVYDTLFGKKLFAIRF